MEAKKKKNKGTKFPWGGILALIFLVWVAATSPILAVVAVIIFGLVPTLTEAIMNLFLFLSELGKKKGGSKKASADHSEDHHSHTDHH